MTHEERVYHHEMETCEGIHEHAERIAALEELVLDLYQEVDALTQYDAGGSRGIVCEFAVRIAELGVEP